jgi:hypothetical protein
MANLVALQQFGYPFIQADMVVVIREKDITKNFLQETIKKMQKAKTISPDKFFEKNKICFLADQLSYEKFLLALREEAKNL